MAVYRMYAVSVMLRNVKVPFKGRSHDYPKVILSQLLLLEYWRVSDHVVWRMMEKNMGCVNEELGELTFSILSRCVLGDHIKSRFDHMNSMFKVLPSYRAIKEEVLADQASSSSLGWRHSIKSDCEEVKSTSLFFKNMIKQIVSNKFLSYDGSKASYKSLLNCRSFLTTEVTPLVFQKEIVLDLNPTFRVIKADLYGYFLQDYKHLWPVPVNIFPVEIESDEEVVEEKEISSLLEQSQLSDGYKFGASWTECKVGCFAVTRTQFENGNGISVWKVMKIIEDDEDGHRFIGKERYTTGDATNISCTRKNWIYLRQCENDKTRISQWNVLTYFENLESGGKFPSHTIEEIKILNDSMNLFQNEAVAEQNN